MGSVLLPQRAKVIPLKPVRNTGTRPHTAGPSRTVTDGDDDDGGNYFRQCVPNGAMDREYVNPVTHPYSCGRSCQDQHEK